MFRCIFTAVSTLAIAGCANVSIETQARKYLSAYEESSLLAGTVLLARGDSIVFFESFGDADVERQLSNTTGTRFRIGSITKSMTWAAVHRLVESGLLDLDGPVAEIIGESALTKEVTVRQLLTHEGGVADWSTFTDFPKFIARASSLDDLTEWIASKPLSFAPGSNRSYSNSGYILLARVIEEVTGDPYGVFLAEEFFQPLGMEATQHDINSAPTQMAQGYSQGHKPIPIVKASNDHPSILVGSGSVVSTIGDLFIWSRSAEAKRFPWDRRTRNGRSVTLMAGFVPGFGAWIEHYTDEDITVVVMINLSNGAIQKIVPDLGAIMLGASYEPPQEYSDGPISDSQRDAFSGSWICEGGTEFTIQPVNQRLEILWRHRGPPQPLWSQSDTELFYPQDWANFSILKIGDTRGLSFRTPGGAIQECILQQDER